MEFIQLEADEDSQYQPISNEVDDDDEELTNNEMEDFIDNSKEPEEDISFYQNLNNRDQYYNFPNQTENLRNAIAEDYEMYLGDGEDSQPELYAPEDRDSLEFDNFSGFEKSVKKFKDTLKNFKESENPFFDSVIYTIMCERENEKIPDKNRAREVLGIDFYNEVFEIKDDIQLDRTSHGYESKFSFLNDMLANNRFFLKIL